MQVQTQQKLVNVTTYVAFDGKEFRTESGCLSYEKANTPLYKRLAISQELACYYPEYQELHSAKCEDSDITASLNDYTKAVIHEVIRALYAKQKDCVNKEVSDESFVYMHLGLNA